jgi:hypothetical protein
VAELDGVMKVFDEIMTRKMKRKEKEKVTYMFVCMRERERIWSGC